MSPTLTRKLLSAKEMIAKIGKIDYKPDHQVSLEIGIHGELVLRISANVLDADGSGLRIKIAREMVICGHYGYTIDQVMHFIQAHLQEFEIHEMYEWLRIHGKRVREPHNEK